MILKIIIPPIISFYNIFIFNACLAAIHSILANEATVFYLPTRHFWHFIEFLLNITLPRVLINLKAYLIQYICLFLMLKHKTMDYTILCISHYNCCQKILEIDKECPLHNYLGWNGFPSGHYGTNRFTSSQFLHSVTFFLIRTHVMKYHVH